MRKNNKKQIILNKIGKKLDFCDKMIMKVLNTYTIKIYRIGLNDAFNCENQKFNKNNSRGCSTAVQLIKPKE